MAKYETLTTRLNHSVCAHLIQTGYAAGQDILLKPVPLRIKDWIVCHLTIDDMGAFSTF